MSKSMVSYIYLILLGFHSANAAAPEECPNKGSSFVQKTLLKDKLSTPTMLSALEAEAEALQSSGRKHVADEQAEAEAGGGLSLAGSTILGETAEEHEDRELDGEGAITSIPASTTTTVTGPGCKECECTLGKTLEFDMAIGGRCLWRWYTVQKEHETEGPCEKLDYEIVANPEKCATIHASTDGEYAYQYQKAGESGDCAEMARKCAQKYDFFSGQYKTECEDEASPHPMKGKRLKGLDDRVVEGICKAACSTDPKCIGYYTEKAGELSLRQGFQAVAAGVGAECTIYGDGLASVIPGFASTTGKGTVINGTSGSGKGACMRKVASTTTTTTAPCNKGDWSEWGRCSVSCGANGTKTRSRLVEPPGCGDTEESTECEGDACPIDCDATDWSDWGECSQECHGGVSTRTRKIETYPQFGGKACVDCNQTEQNRTCGASPVNCEYSPWSQWGTCSKKCNTGVQKRDRNIAQHPKCGGIPCSCDVHPLLEMRNCFNEECKVPCEFSKWSEWSECPVTCGGAVHTRERKLLKVPAAGGKECPELVESQNCGMIRCHTDCVPGDWADWSECSATCWGTKSRARDVLVLPAGDGQACDDLQEWDSCNRDCKLDCEVSEWADWSTCMKSCGGGSSTRQRRITQNTANGGEQCPELTQVRNCSCVECGKATHSDAEGGEHASDFSDFPEPGTADFNQLKMHCAGVAPDYDQLKKLFAAHGGLHATIEYCLEMHGKGDFEEDYSEHYPNNNNNNEIIEEEVQNNNVQANEKEANANNAGGDSINFNKNNINTRNSNNNNNNNGNNHVNKNSNKINNNNKNAEEEVNEGNAQANAGEANAGSNNSNKANNKNINSANKDTINSNNNNIIEEEVDEGNAQANEGEANAGNSNSNNNAAANEGEANTGNNNSNNNAPANEGEANAGNNNSNKAINKNNNKANENTVSSNNNAPANAAEEASSEGDAADIIASEKNIGNDNSGNANSGNDNSANNNINNNAPANEGEANTGNNNSNNNAPANEGEANTGNNNSNNNAPANEGEANAGNNKSNNNAPANAAEEASSEGDAAEIIASENNIGNDNSGNANSGNDNSANNNGSANSGNNNSGNNDKINEEKVNQGDAADEESSEGDAADIIASENNSGNDNSGNANSANGNGANNSGDGENGNNNGNNGDEGKGAEPQVVKPEPATTTAEPITTVQSTSDPTVTIAVETTQHPEANSEAQVSTKCTCRTTTYRYGDGTIARKEIKCTKGGVEVGEHC